MLTELETSFLRSFRSSEPQSAGLRFGIKFAKLQKQSQILDFLKIADCRVAEK